MASGLLCYLPAKCPICGKPDTKALYLHGFDKCVECLELVKSVYRSRNVHCSCLCLFYGSLVGPQLEAYRGGCDNPLAKEVE